MNMRDKYRLTSNRTYLLDNVDVQHVSNWLLSEQILTEDEQEELSSISNPRDRCARLLNWLPRKGPSAYGNFRRSLDGSPTQMHIGNVLDATDTSSVNATDTSDARPVRVNASAAQQSQHPRRGVGASAGYNIQVSGSHNVVVTGGNGNIININR
ncbi:uncharacterized protein [Antedon mediterranea]